MTFNINDTVWQHSTISKSVIMLSVTFYLFAMMSVIKLNAIMLSVVAPLQIRSNLELKTRP
jgi:hypothetical protein